MKVNHQAQSTRGQTAKSELVQKFYNHYTLILKVLFDGDKNVSTIFQKVKNSRDRSFPYKSSKGIAIDVTNELVKHQLAEEKIIQPKHKRKAYRIKKNPKPREKIIRLTPLGYDLSNLIHLIDEYKQNHVKLKEKINHYFDIDVGTKAGVTAAVLANRLRQKEWTAEEIPNYGSLLEEILFLETHLPLVILSSLLSRYLKIVFDHNPLNKVSKEILEKVTMDAIGENILERLRGILADKIFVVTSERESAFNKTYWLLSGWTTAHFQHHANIYSRNRFIQAESLDLVKTLFGILSPGADFLQNKLGKQAETNVDLGHLIKLLEESKKELRKS